jgi:hypothetical protein
MPTKRSQGRPEYAPPESDQSEPVRQARLQLIEATKRVVPKFLEKLATEVLPVYSRLAREGKLSKNGYDFQKALWSENLRQILEDVLADDLKQALLRWAAEFHASGAPWIVLDALRSLDDWDARADRRASRQWNTIRERSGEALPAAEPLEFRYGGWDVMLFTWPAYRALVRRKLAEHLLKYERNIRKRAETHGWVRTSGKSSRGNLEWFALYQFAGLSSGQICRKYEAQGQALAESTVLKGVKAVAARIGWEDLRNSRQSPNRKNR